MVFMEFTKYQMWFSILMVGSPQVQLPTLFLAVWVKIKCSIIYLYISLFILFPEACSVGGASPAQACYYWAGPWAWSIKINNFVNNFQKLRPISCSFSTILSLTWYFLEYFPLLIMIYDTKMHIIKKIKVVDKTKGQIMPSNITQPLKSRHGDGDGSSAPTSKSNLNWLFYNRSIKNKFCLRLLLRDWLRMYSLSTLKSCCIIHFFKISLFKGILVNQFWLVSGNVPPQVIRLKLFSFMQLCEKHENDCLEST